MNINNATYKDLKDYGKFPFVFNIDKFSLINPNFRTALWTGDNFQLTLMTIQPGDDIGLEVHSDVDQFIRIEMGTGLTQLGDSKDNLEYEMTINPHYAVIIPAGTWHNITNTGTEPLKLYSIYAPAEHPYGTIDRTKKDAEKRESQ